MKKRVALEGVFKKNRKNTNRVTLGSKKKRKQLAEKPAVQCMSIEATRLYFTFYDLLKFRFSQSVKIVFWSAVVSQNRILECCNMYRRLLANGSINGVGLGGSGN